MTNRTTERPPSAVPGDCCCCHLDLPRLGELPHKRVAVRAHAHDAVRQLRLEQPGLALDAPEHEFDGVGRLIVLELLRVLKGELSDPQHVLHLAWVRPTAMGRGRSEQGDDVLLLLLFPMSAFQIPFKCVRACDTLGKRIIRYVRAEALILPRALSYSDAWPIRMPGH